MSFFYPRHHLFGVTILAQLVSDDVLDSAYAWLCRRRRDYSANSDVWSFRQCWPREKERIKAELLSGNGFESLQVRQLRSCYDRKHLKTSGMACARTGCRRAAGILAPGRYPGRKPAVKNARAESQQMRPGSGVLRIKKSCVIPR